MPPLLREPVVQFVLIGLALYLSLGLLNAFKEPRSEAQVIHITGEDIARIEQAMVTQLANRGFTLAVDSEQYAYELDRAIDNHVVETLLYREALAQDLGHNDPQIRARLVSKARLLAMEAASMAPITDDEVTAYYNERTSEFTTPKTLDLWQLFFARSQRMENTRRDCIAAYETVTANPNIPLGTLAALGDSSPKYRQDMRYINRDQITALFGTQTAQQLFALKQGEWLGPIISQEGCHIARVLTIHPRRTNPLSEVKPNILQSIESNRNQQALDEYTQQLKAKYEVRIDQ